MPYRQPLSALALALLLGIASAAPVGLDAIVAVVNDDVITQSELDASRRQIVAQLERKGTPLPPAEVIERQVLERMILIKLQLQAAKRAGIEVDEATLAEAIGNIARSNGISLAEMRATLERDGVRFETFRDELKRELITTRLRQSQVINRITVSDQEVERYLASETQAAQDAYRLSHILVATPDAASPEQLAAANAKAESLLAELHAGADFGALAVRESQGRNALEGGDLGWIEAGRLPTLFAEVVPKLAPGELAGPLRSSSGFHIVRLEEVRGAPRRIVQQTEVRHILVRPNELVSDDEARQRLRALRERLQGGEEFNVLARAHSDDKGSAIRGGELGWVNPGDLTPEFEQAMNRLAPGEISEPVRTPFGWHLLEVLGRRQHDSTDEVVRANAKQALRARKAEEAVEQWLRQLRDEAYVELRAEPS